MALLSATDAALFLGVNRRSLGRQRQALAERGLVKRVGGRWQYESEGLKAAWPEVAHHQIGNAPTLDRLAREVASGAEPPEASFWREFGRWAPGEAQTQQQYWQHVAAIANGLMGSDLPPERVEVLAQQLGEAAADVDLGARWNGAKWAAASARLEAEEATEASPL